MALGMYEYVHDFFGFLDFPSLPRASYHSFFTYLGVSQTNLFKSRTLECPGGGRVGWIGHSDGTSISNPHPRIREKHCDLLIVGVKDVQN